MYTSFYLVSFVVVHSHLRAMRFVLCMSCFVSLFCNFPVVRVKRAHGCSVDVDAKLLDGKITCETD